MVLVVALVEELGPLPTVVAVVPYIELEPRSHTEPRWCLRFLSFDMREFYRARDENGAPRISLDPASYKLLERNSFSSLRKRMRSGDRPGLQNRWVAGDPVTDGFDPHSLPPFIYN